ncbi:hypothetical protein [Streptomyces arenae]|uniref:hypothetical protein n=1 Tax=Streptomyces arenae TaxID=29301 RepID=UPI0026591143|nr:hypothetical protein [Streptomyces arenae]MCG7204264.1 hypothetical protein [Streptomyces arenae]
MILRLRTAGRRGDRTAGALRWTARPALLLLRRAPAVLAPAVLLTALLPAPSAVADGGSGYAFAAHARTVHGATGTADAEPLEPGTVYRSSLPDKGARYYRLELPAAETAYVPVTAVPPADATVSASDGIAVSVENANGTSCDYQGARFGAGLSPRPITAVGRRDAGRALCQDAGTYYVVVERLVTGSKTTTPGSWDLEIAPITEPALARAGATTAPQSWDSASPRPLTGDPHRRTAGAGFSTARTLGEGVWGTDITPGQTLYYAVPVDWGQQLHATVDLGSTSGDAHGYVSAALNLSLYNPVRGYVDDISLGYDGTQKSSSLDPLPPVAYANRYAVSGEENAVRFAGAYYLVVHLTGQTSDTFGQGPYGVTLRVRVDGTPNSGPAYAGSPVPKDVFDAPAVDRGDLVSAAGDDDPAMRALAAAGIGTGTALLLVLGVWTLTARRAQTRVNAQKPTA